MLKLNYPLDMGSYKLNLPHPPLFHSPKTRRTPKSKVCNYHQRGSKIPLFGNDQTPFCEK